MVKDVCPNCDPIGNGNRFLEAADWRYVDDFAGWIKQVRQKHGK